MDRKAVIYARQSSGSDDYSESVEVQIANCRKLAGNMQIRVVKCLSDLNISGKTYPVGWEKLAAADSAFQKWSATHTRRNGFRPALGKLITLLPDIDCIIVDDITRLYRPLSRSFLEAAVNETLIENNVQILQVKGGTIDLAQFDQQLVTMLKNQINDEQIAKQRMRSIEVFNKLRDSGVMPTGITAFGLNYDRTTKRYKPDPAKSEVIKFVFREVLAGSSYSQIIHDINCKWRNLFSSCFWEKSVYTILNKPIYAGYQYNTAGELIKNHQGRAIITLEDFMAAQLIVQQRRHERLNRTHLRLNRQKLPLSGLLYCGICGSKLVVSTEKGNTVYYCRRGSLCNDEKCRASRIALYCSKGNLTGLFELVSALLGEALLHDNTTVNTLPCSGAADSLPPWYAQKLRQLTDEYIKNNLPEAIFHEALAGLKRQLEKEHRLSEKPLAAPASSPAPDSYRVLQIRTLLKNIRKKSLPPELFHTLAMQSVGRIDVYGEKVVLHCHGKTVTMPRIVHLRQKGFDRATVQTMHNNCISRLQKMLKKQTDRKNEQ